MHVIQHNSNTSKSFQIMISTELENIYFGNSTNNNNITFILETSKRTFARSKFISQKNCDSKNETIPR